jgi:hypothetical protein
MPADEKTIKRIIQEVLSDMNWQGCNTPIVKENVTFGDSVVPSWDVVFTCDNPDDRNHRHKAKFSVETPPEKSESEIKADISRILEQQLGRK